MPTDQAVLETLPPEKLLLATRLRVIRGAIRMLTESRSLDPYISHERKGSRRKGILRMLQDRKDELSETAENSSGDRPLKQHPKKGSHSAQFLRIHEEYEPCLAGRELAPDWEDLWTQDNICNL
jgi:hypothetical protein